VAGTPSRADAQAIPSAWLPADAVTTRLPGGSAAIAAIAPRTLNEPVGWNVSSLSDTSRPLALETINGVGVRCSLMTARARSKSRATGSGTVRMADGNRDHPS